MRLNAPESRPLAAFRGQRVHAVAGIGNPQRFFRELRAQGMELTEHAFPDHYPLQRPGIWPSPMSERCS